MSWIPENPGIIPLLGSLSAAFGTVASALGSLGRFSRAAKARRTIDWINNTLDQNNDGDGRQHALKELRASQEARLIAIQYVPWWRFMLLPLWMILIGSLLLYTIAQGKFSNQAKIVTLYYLVFCSWFAWLFIGSYYERMRIVEHHKAGLLTEPRIPLWRMGNKVFIYAACFSVAASSFCGAVILSGRSDHSEFLAGGGIAVGFLVLPALIPFVRLRAREWVDETKGGSELVGSNSGNILRFLAKLLDFDVFRKETARK